MYICMQITFNDKAKTKGNWKYVRFLLWLMQLFEISIFLGFSLSIRYLPINAPARKANNEAKAIFSYSLLYLLYSHDACLFYLIITVI